MVKALRQITDLKHPQTFPCTFQPTQLVGFFVAALHPTGSCVVLIKGLATISNVDNFNISTTS